MPRVQKQHHLLVAVAVAVAADSVVPGHEASVLGTLLVCTSAERRSRPCD
jgi:hypothetical protein